MAIRLAFTTAAAVIFAAVTLWACSYGFEVTAVDLSTTKPRFEVQPTDAFFGFSHQPAIVEISVYEKQPVAGHAVRWRVVAEQATEIKTITYSVAPPGFLAEVEPQPLAPGISYELGVRAPGGGGSTHFVISESSVTSSGP